MPPSLDKGAINALHEGAEVYMVTLMEDANLLTIHARRATLQPRDVQLARKIREIKIGTLSITQTDQVSTCK